MDATMFEGLALKGDLLCEAVIYVDPETTPGPIGPAPWGNRLIAYIKEGEFSGPKMKGKVLPGGGDWINLASERPNALKVNVRAVWETDDGAKLYLSYTGRIIYPETKDNEEPVDASSLDPSQYYFRVSPTFETSHPKYLWLNDIVCVGVGRQIEGGVAYRMYHIT
tara:strand:- start:132 stop:629 length:498 start_codon:yes stop_codon:yes gene_type:complete